MKKSAASAIAGLVAIVLSGCAGGSVESSKSPSAPAVTSTTAAPSSPASPSASASTAPDVEVSAVCEAAMVALGEVEAGVDFEAEDAAVLASLKACGSSDEYVAATRLHPESWLYADAKSVDEAILLIGACRVDGAAETAVCKD